MRAQLLFIKLHTLKWTCPLFYIMSYVPSIGRLVLGGRPGKVVVLPCMLKVPLVARRGHSQSMLYKILRKSEMHGTARIVICVTYNNAQAWNSLHSVEQSPRPIRRPTTRSNAGSGSTLKRKSLQDQTAVRQRLADFIKNMESFVDGGPPFAEGGQQGGLEFSSSSESSQVL